MSFLCQSSGKCRHIRLQFMMRVQNEEKKKKCLQKSALGSPQKMPAIQEREKGLWCLQHWEAADPEAHGAWVCQPEERAKQQMPPRQKTQVGESWQSYTKVAPSTQPTYTPLCLPKPVWCLNFWKHFCFVCICTRMINGSRMWRHFPDERHMRQAALCLCLCAAKRS